ncbi:MAG: MBL fold metallo-hydrolase [Candidatus Azobacteroides sp.]|nr:MBL fold metallo-hydrolase [Candidatus Azobacteroides sp.]
MQLRFLSLASGSSGNCYYLGNSTAGILIDAGIAIRSIKKGLRENNIPFENIVGLFVTHDHGDHIKNVGSLGERYHIPVYTTELVHMGMDRSRWVNEKLCQSRRIIEKNVPFKLFDFTITPFEVPHNGTDNVGFHIEYQQINIVFATDLGCIPDEVATQLCLADYLILEANYDEEMLQQSRYPYYLKTRISGMHGHLCNMQAADFLANYYSERLKHVFLCHLSKENNHPELAYKTIEYRLAQNNIRVGTHLQLSILKRNSPTELFFLG